jgi:hypothetical protein
MSTKNMFHVIEQDELRSLLNDSILLGSMDTYNEPGMKEIPVFRSEIKLPNFVGKEWCNPKKVEVHVLIGKEYKSYFLFVLRNKYGRELKLALPMEDNVMMLPVIQMSKEIRFTSEEKRLTTKGDRKKAIAIVPLRNEAHEVFKYGLALFLDKSGMLNPNQSEAVAVKDGNHAQ